MLTTTRFFIVFYFALHGTAFAGTLACDNLLEAGPSWRDSVDFPAIEKRLEEAADVRNVIPIREYLNAIGKKASTTAEVYLVEFQDGTRAIFKPNLEIAKAEVGAYRVSQFLGLPFVPPTVFATIQGRHGSLMLFVDSPHDFLADSQNRKALPGSISNHEKNAMHAFDAVLGQWDRHAGNLILDQHGRIAVIDNEDIQTLTYMPQNSVPFIRRKILKEPVTNEPSNSKILFPISEVKYLNGGSETEVAQFKERYGFYGNLEKDFTRYSDKHLPYVIWRNALWTPKPLQSFGPHNLSEISKALAEKLATLDEATLKELATYMTDEHIEFALTRRDLILLHGK